MEKIEFSKSRKTRIRKKKLDRLYDKKPAIEFIVALLSVPSLLLLLVLNFKSLTISNNAKPTPTPSTTVSIPGATRNFFTKPVNRAVTLPNESQAPCIKGLGSVSITSPNEGDMVTNNPVEVDISYDNSTYCSAVWSYSVNGGSWSDYNNYSVALYNLPNGPVRFQLRVKSLTSSDSTTLTRNFTYAGQSTAPMSTASGAAY